MAVAASLLSVSLLSVSFVLTAISLILLTAIVEAFLKPLIMIWGLIPCSIWSFISFSMLPASTTTEVVPSPTSASCDRAMSTRIRAAGWTISRSLVVLGQAGSEHGAVDMYLHHCSAIVRNRLSAVFIHHQQIASIWPKGGLQGLLHGKARVDVGNDLPFSLRGVGSCRVGSARAPSLPGIERRLTLLENDDGRCLTAEGHFGSMDESDLAT